ncbi:MAG: transcriptional repressor [Candidatus Melainabacteria bacterium HGW-Melainabacteria-1]|nr:MAG: transcriptional repressor [Candidatus Melainabacteria bacterium HGW-Melainabacteria-1]
MASLSQDLSTALKSLKASGLKLTRTRRALLEVLVKEHGPFTIEELQQRLDGSCDIATVYRNMTAFGEFGLVRPCDFGDGLTRYEWAHSHEHHHHIICQRCRLVEELEHCVVEELEQLVASRGYSNVSHRLEFYGLCQNCQT